MGAGSKVAIVHLGAAITPFAEDRSAVVRAFATLPDEAFGFFAGQMFNMSLEAGGFQADSRLAVEALGRIVQSYYRDRAGQQHTASDIVAREQKGQAPP